jgi:hypothetical protein
MFLIIDLTFKKKIKYLNPGQCVFISSNAKIYTLQGVTDQHSCKCSAEPSVLYCIRRLKNILPRHIVSLQNKCAKTLRNS